MKKIILASSSPRRIEMMQNHGYEPEIMPADIDETLPMKMSPEASVMYLAQKKASKISQITTPNSLIIAADTVIVYNNEIIGKPSSKKQAFEILTMLCGKKHEVITGVCVFPRKVCFFDKTYVYFKNYNDEELMEYINTPEPYDKAGGYAIQGTFKKYIEHIEGDFDNVVGFPWYKIEKEIFT